jgi:hypothetical protein
MFAKAYMGEKDGQSPSNAFCFAGKRQRPRSEILHHAKAFEESCKHCLRSCLGKYAP